MYITDNQAVMICLYYFKVLRERVPELDKISLYEAKKLAEVEIAFYQNKRKDPKNFIQ